MKPRLLIIEPEEKARRLCREALPVEEFLLRMENSGERGIECALDWKPALVLLESKLPGIAGLDVCRLLKADPRTRRIAIFFISQACTQPDVIAALKCGADEHLAKPFHPNELLWRVKGLLRRYQEAGTALEPLVSYGSIIMDSEQGLCTIAGKTLRLTPKELALLEIFIRRPNRVLKRRFLLETIWGYDQDIRTRVVDITLYRLRRKLGPLGRRFETLPGFGYILRPL